MEWPFCMSFKQTNFCIYLKFVTFETVWLYLLRPEENISSTLSRLILCWLIYLQVFIFAGRLKLEGMIWTCAFAHILAIQVYRACVFYSPVRLIYNVFHISFIAYKTKRWWSHNVASKVQLLVYKQMKIKFTMDDWAWQVLWKVLLVLGLHWVAKDRVLEMLTPIMSFFIHDSGIYFRIPVQWKWNFTVTQYVSKFNIFWIDDSEWRMRILKNGLNSQTLWSALEIWAYKRICDVMTTSAIRVIWMQRRELQH